MDEKKKQLPRLSLFHPRIADLGEYGTFSDADFERATTDEKASMVETHKSVSYWADAARRFKKNTVSMVALVVVLIIILFAFVGPTLIPYSYEEQYRSAMKLGPFKYSEGEQLVKDLIEKEGADLVYASSPQIIARCTRDAKTPGMCLSERRIEGADLTFRFPRDWLTKWRDVAGAMDQIIARMRRPHG